jgi:hypothetical protein
MMRISAVRPLGSEEMSIQPGCAQDSGEKRRIEAAIAEQIEQLGVLVDDLKLRSHLSSIEARDRTRPHIENAEQDLRHAKADLRELADASAEAWPWVHRSLERSLEGARTAFRQARRNFTQAEP